jgi:hypothetical protein
MVSQRNSSSPSLAPSEPSVASRPTSLALPSNTDIGMFYSPEYLDPMAVYDFQSPSPWASTHSLGLIHDPPPINTSLDLEQTDRLTGGALLSPSASEHLLPSNLFGPDEDHQIRTSPYIDQLLESPALMPSPRIVTNFGPVPRPGDSPISEISTRSSFSSPNQSIPILTDRMYQDSPTIIMTPAPRYPPDEEVVVEVTSPAELNGIPLSAENTDEENPEVPEVIDSTSSTKHWKIPSISFRRKASLPPEKRLPLLGTLRGEKARSMPRTSAGIIPIGFNRPRSGSGGSGGWIQHVTRARAPSETGRQFDINFDPLESRRLLEGAGVVHQREPSFTNHSPLSPHRSGSFSGLSRRSVDNNMSRLYSPPAFFRTPGVYSEMSASSYGWMSPLPSVPAPPAPAINVIPSVPPAGTWSPPSTSRSSLDPKAPEFRSNLQFILPEPPEPETVDLPRRFGSRFNLQLSRRSTLKSGDGSFLNNFTGFFRRETKPGEDEDNELTRPKSVDTQLSAEPATNVDDVASDGAPDKKKKEKKKRDKGKGKSIFRWESKADTNEDSELKSSKSTESMKIEEPEGEQSPKTRKKRRGKKGVKFEKEETEKAEGQSNQDTESFAYQNRDFVLDDIVL